MANRRSVSSRESFSPTNRPGVFSMLKVTLFPFRSELMRIRL